MKSVLILILSLAIWLRPVPALSTTLVPLTMSEEVALSSLIFQGRVSETWVSGEGDMLYTHVRFEVEEVIKGDVNGDTLELRFMGGEDAEVSVRVSELVLPAQGERGIYFVEDLTQDLVNPLLGWSQGHYVIRRDPDGNELVFTNARQPLRSLAAQKQTALRAKLDTLQLPRSLADDVSASTFLTPGQFKQEIRDLMEAQGQ